MIKSATAPANRRIVIGDVHGHYDGLMQLLEAIAPGRSDDIYFLGDLIDRGPKSADVIKFVQGQHYHCIMGNHEQMLLDAFPDGKVAGPSLQAWLYSGGQATVSSYASPTGLLDDLDWIQQLPLYYDLGDIWLVHAGLHPQLPLAEQTSQEFCWIREQFHGSPKPYFQDKLVIIGHTITFTLPGVTSGAVARGHGWVDIDTGAYHSKSGWLTGLDIDQQMIYQVNVQDGSTRILSLDEACVDVAPERFQRRVQAN